MLIDNIVLLRARFPEIRNYFLEHENKIELNRLTILESKTGAKTIRYQTTEGNPLMIHSLYDPIREAERIITAHSESIMEDTHVFFYGVGLGYHIEKFKEMYPSNTYSIYEPCPEVFFELTQQRKLNQLITKKTLQLYIDTYEKEAMSYLKEFVSSNQNIYIITLPSYENLFKEKMIQFRSNVKKVITNRRSRLHTNEKFQKRWTINSVHNFKSVLTTPNMMKDIKLEQFKRKPAMIISAGPSLVEDMEFIRYIKKNELANIFSVGSAINSLLEYDVIPDAVCTYAPSDNNYKVFERLNDSGLHDIPLIYGSSVGFETLERFTGPKVHFITTVDNVSQYFLGSQINANDCINDATSIAVLMVQLLSEIGCDPIIFAGQNLAYKDDEIYAKGIGYTHLKNGFNKEIIKKGVPIKDVYGNEIKSNITFNNMRESIEQIVTHYKGNTFINTTKGGAEIKGVPFCPIEQVIEEVLTHSIIKEKWWETANSYDQSVLSDKLNSLENYMHQFYNIIENINKLIRKLNKNIALKNRINLEKAFGEFDYLYSNLNENMYYRKFVVPYVRVHVDFLINEMNHIVMEADPIKKANHIVELFTRFIQNCRSAGVELEQLINEQIDRQLISSKIN
ncbi:DUF115 domain-containing protein [Agaribacter marinus]|uniref:Motility associated factor glycosyltransferase family protein n=1 Tax=Virgibacillus salarius TaxID=447199 RepID=A0A941DZK8_9BACI|nr:6-hydroxymethylpterin diphosphokinase MptE-like protein [Virgibacillus salarius]MBR7797053.1 motility associated factor glycosyltransferase family protein [Virgibacillus salarius]NAZ09762.1 DUF115 domain-containing protein [Agaribacter marinus]